MPYRVFLLFLLLAGIGNSFRNILLFLFDLEFPFFEHILFRSTMVELESVSVTCPFLGCLQNQNYVANFAGATNFSSNSKLHVLVLSYYKQEFPRRDELYFIQQLDNQIFKLP